MKHTADLVVKIQGKSLKDFIIVNEIRNSKEDWKE